MKQSFTENYIKIYVLQAMSVFVGFISLFIVIPAISSNKPIYGVYAICTSIVVFLSYADIGFLSSGAKFAAEYFAKGNKRSEMEVLGFSCAVLLSVVLFFAFLFLILSIKPSLLITGLSLEQASVASSLLLIMACSAPVLALLRITQIIYSIRVIDYEIQFMLLISNLFKVVSAYYFFREDHYDIVGYFFFIQIMNLSVFLFAWIRLVFGYKYSICDFLKSIKFSKNVFDQTKSLAVSSLFVTVCWILYYELDNVSIGKILTAEDVALYAVGYNVLSLIRSILGVFYSPFSARFNHFIGLSMEKDLRSFLINIMIISFPIVIFLLMPLFLMSRQLVVAWVGGEYVGAIPIVKLLILCNIMAFVSYPMGMIVVAKKKLRAMYVSSALLPIVFWFGIYVEVENLGVLSFALFKLVAFTISSFYYLYLLNKYFSVSVMFLLRKIIIPYIPALLAVLFVMILFTDIDIEEKSKLNLLLVGAIEATVFCFGILFSIPFVPELRRYAREKIVPLIQYKFSK